MPGREIPLVEGEIYHITNRGISDQPVFLSKNDYRRAIDTILYYQNLEPPIRYSFFIRLALEQRQDILKTLIKEKNFLVEIICYCLMPNHIHLLVKQLKQSGISKFMGNLTNSYTRYFNTRQSRRGPIFQGKFKAVRIESEEQLLHVSRYIHLNPFSSYVVKSLPAIEQYPYSSFGNYTGFSGINNCQKESILNHFKNPVDYKNFVFDQANYQRELESIKHLLLEK